MLDFMAYIEKDSLNVITLLSSITEYFSLNIYHVSMTM